MLTLRPLDRPGDPAAYADIYNASNAFDKIEESFTVEDVEHLLAKPTNFDPLADVVLAEIEGQPVGAARTWWRDDKDGSRVYWHEAFLRPEWRRRGLGRQMLAWLENRARALAVAPGTARPAAPDQDSAPDQEAERAAPAATVRLRAYVEDTAIGKQALLAAAGYQPVRFWHFMQRASLDDLPAVALPPGLEWRAAQPGQLRAIWDAKEEAFADHWGSDPPSEAKYQAWATQPTHDPALWPIAWDTVAEQIAGVSLNSISAADNELYGFKRGWINSLGVREPWRGRGLGRALLIHGLHLLRAAGMTEAVLGVDIDNATGAPRLYESAGFVTINKDVIFEKVLVNG